MGDETINTKKDSFRDKLSTVAEDGKRVWVFPKKPNGRFTRYRLVVYYVLLFALFIVPFVKVNGFPLLLLDILERKFVIFGQTFWPQDFILFLVGLITLIVFIILFTIVFGRIFCGWICPQTVFMEGIFRQIEYWIEGDYTAQKKLDKQEWNNEKILKKTLKHAVFLLISFLIMHTFISYLVGVEKLWGYLQESPMENLGLFGAMFIFTFLFYGVFAGLREQVCTSICPYGRLQGVLLDTNSIIVAYDYKRGEPRGKLRKNKEREDRGDCIDCKQCVYVCPTGIDIRNGTQLECVNCTACIDACDEIMDRIKKPRGLVRYASEKNISMGFPFRFTAKMRGYTVVLLLLLGGFTALLFSKSDYEIIVLRKPGMTYQKRDDGTISNLYELNLVNKSYEKVDLELKLIAPQGSIKIVGGVLSLAPQEVITRNFFIILEREKIIKLSSEIELEILNKGQKIKSITTKFLGPPKK